MRVPSPYARTQLKTLLLDTADMAPDAFRDFLRRSGYGAEVNRINFGGTPDEAYTRAIDALAGAGKFDATFFDMLVVEPELNAWSDRMDELRIEFEVDPPRAVHFVQDRLDVIAAAAQRAGLHTGRHYAAMVRDTPHELRLRTSGPQRPDPEWVGALLAAANRKMPTTDDPSVWMADVLRIAVDNSTDEEHRAFVQALAELQVAHIDDPRVGEPLVATGGQLERIVMPDGFAVDAGTLEDWLGKVRARTCLIRVGGDDKGTGVLVGPDLVLTNWHVLFPVIEGSPGIGDRPGGSIPPDTVRFVFDYTTVGGQESATVESGLLEAEAGAGNDPWMVDWAPAADDEMVENPDPPFDESIDDDRLDFALVRIDQCRGDDRGYFPLVRTDFGFRENAAIMIAGHPVALEQPASVFSSKRTAQRLVCSIEPRSSIGTNPNATRARYRTNTFPGSSGSPVFNDEFEFVALHHFGRSGSYNQGIPLAAIHRRLEHRNKLDHLP